ncbi:MAG: ATP--guanido phosphotransferase [Clostridia bacterium]
MIQDAKNIVISSRIRLARNLKEYKFTNRISEEDSNKIVQKVASSLSNNGEYRVYSMKPLDFYDAMIMQEKHLISSKLAENKFGAVLVSKNEEVSIMVNEEDHIRAQCIKKGLSLEDAYTELAQIDDYLSECMEYAFDDNLGYLTACVTNLGTGMRASCMMFLPAITLSESVSSLVSFASSKGLTVRGIYGEGTLADGYMYQISNSISLGLSEREIICNVKDVVMRIVALENSERKRLLQTKFIEIKDRILRAWGICTNAYKLNSTEILKYLGDLKFGVMCDIIRLKDASILDLLSTQCMPHNIRKISEKNLTQEEIEVFRAKYVASSLKGKRIL